MKVIFFLRELNATSYEQHPSETGSLPRMGETVTITRGPEKKHYQVIGVNHIADNGSIEIYCVHTEPSWEVKKSGSIGFNFR